MDAATGSPLVDVIVDAAGMKGTGTWTVQTALDLGIPVSGIAEAVFARGLSSLADQRAASRSLPGPVPGAVAPVDVDAFVEDVRRALYASKIVAYAQGFDEIAAGSAEYGWDIDRGALARIWRGGCIIRAAFLARITEAYDGSSSDGSGAGGSGVGASGVGGSGVGASGVGASGVGGSGVGGPSAGTSGSDGAGSDRSVPDGSSAPASLLLAPYFTDALGAVQDSWRRVVAAAATSGVPTPGFSTALAYYDGLRSERLPAALIQAQRDFFRRPHLPAR